MTEVVVWGIEDFGRDSNVRISFEWVRSVGVCNWYARKVRKEGRKDLRNLKGNTSWAKYDVVRGDKYQAQWAFVSKAPRKASQPFLSMTPSSARLLDKLPHTADRWKGKKTKLTEAVRVNHDDIS